MAVITGQNFVVFNDFTGIVAIIVGNWLLCGAVALYELVPNPAGASSIGRYQVLYFAD